MTLPEYVHSSPFWIPQECLQPLQKIRFFFFYHSLIPLWRRLLVYNDSFCPYDICCLCYWHLLESLNWCLFTSVVNIYQPNSKSESKASQGGWRLTFEMYFFKYKLFPLIYTKQSLQALTTCCHPGTPTWYAELHATDWRGRELLEYWKLSIFK